MRWYWNGFRAPKNDATSQRKVATSGAIDAEDVEKNFSGNVRGNCNLLKCAQRAAEEIVAAVRWAHLNNPRVAISSSQYVSVIQSDA